MRLDVSELIARLLPGDSEANFPAELLEQKKWHYRWDALWRIQFDAARQIDSITYFDAFPAGIDIAGLRIGMNSEEIAARGGPVEIIWTDPANGDTYLRLPGAGATVRYAGITKGTLSVLEIVRESSTGTFILDYVDEMRARRRAKARPVTTDPDELLDNWAEDARYLTFDRSVLPRFLTWLRDASPDQWHAMVDRWNWDNGTVPLKWILHQPNCDRATAVLIHERADASYFRAFAGDRERVPSINRPGYDLVIGIRQRLAAGEYPRSELAIEERLTDIGLGDGLVIEATRGRTVSSGCFNEGIPAELFADG